MKQRSLALAALLALLFSTSLSAATDPSRPPQPLNAAALQLGLQKLGVVGNVLYLAAHPDDENTAMLAWLANDRLVRAGYLSMTRGDGGQNLIGDEKGDALGVIRTQELLAARRTDGAEQFFTRAIDFGFSKGPEETLAIWNHDEVLADIVWVIRKFQPDVIITRFPTTGEGGHGHHTASAILAEEAFDAAADPSRFPEQLAWVKPWKTRRLFWNSWLPQNEKDKPADPTLLSMDLGRYNALLGKEYTEVAAESRTMHKSQGFGSEARRGNVLNYLKLRKGEGATTDLLEGVDTSWGRVAGGAAVGQQIAEANRLFDPNHPESTVPRLGAIYAALRTLPDEPHVIEKRAEALNLLRAAAGLWLEAIATQPVVTAGEKLELKATIVARTSTPVTIDGWSVQRNGTPLVESRKSQSLKSNESATETLSFEVPKEIPVTAPYWLLEPYGGAPGKPAGLFHVPSKQLIGDAENAPAFSAFANVTIGGQSVSLEVPVLYRWTDRVRGEQYRGITVAPPLTARIDRKVLLSADGSARPLSVRVENESAAAREAIVSLALPAGWRSEPASLKLTVAPRGSSEAAHFRITPPAGSSSGEVKVLLNGGLSSEQARSMVVLDYPHIPIQTLFPIASSRVVRADVKHLGQRIGYIAGSGDEVPQALEQIGYDVHFLSDDEITNQPLKGYDAIVAGVRAFNVRESLRTQLPQLLRYVEEGGTFVVQYNTADETLAKNIGPFPLEIGRDRVTEENAVMTIVDPNEALLQRPNKITAADFESWVQERGLNFASKWDPKYRSVFTSHDAGEKELAGGLLVANYGKGVYIDTGYSFFRQLPAGVPGAYRLLANLVSARQ